MSGQLIITFQAHIKLREENRPKLARLAVLLLRKLQALAAASPPRLGETAPLAAALRSIAAQARLEVAQACIETVFGT